MVSLAAVAAEFAGSASDWLRAIGPLQRAGLLDEASARAIAWCYLFGQWIANNDMHPNNLSLAPQGDGFALLPIYDMTPMAVSAAAGRDPGAPAGGARPARAYRGRVGRRREGGASLLAKGGL